MLMQEITPLIFRRFFNDFRRFWYVHYIDSYHTVPSFHPFLLVLLPNKPKNPNKAEQNGTK